MRRPLVFAAVVAGVGLSCGTYAAAQPVGVRKASSATSAATENAVTRPEHVRLMQEYIRLLGAKDIDGWIELWAENGGLQMPFAPGGGEPQLTGRELILEHFRTTPAFFSRIDYSVPVVRSLAGGSPFFAEFTGNLEVRATGRPYRSRYAMLVEIENGRIKLLREYFNPEALGYARGDLPANAAQGGASVRHDLRGIWRGRADGRTWSAPRRSSPIPTRTAEPSARR